MNNRRKLIIALGAGVYAAPFGSLAQQQSGKVNRIGFLGATSLSGYGRYVDALRAGLLDLGYVDGKNLVFEFRWADGKYDLLPALAAELVRLNVDVLVTHGTPGTRAAKQATTTTPIVMATSGDVLATGKPYFNKPRQPTSFCHGLSISIQTHLTKSGSLPPCHPPTPLFLCERATGDDKDKAEGT